MRISDWSSDVCSSDLLRHSGEGRNLDGETPACAGVTVQVRGVHFSFSGKGAKIASTQSSVTASGVGGSHFGLLSLSMINERTPSMKTDRKSTRLNSSH